jgi:gliding motility-associated-like protein
MRKFIHEHFSRLLLVLLTFTIHSAFSQTVQINSVSTVGTTCNGGTDGSFTVTFEDNIPSDYELELFKGSVSVGTHQINGVDANTPTTYTFSGLDASNDYTVIVTDRLDALNTSTSGSEEIEEPTKVVLNYRSHNVLCKGDATGAVKLLPSGGTAPNPTDYTFKKGNSSWGIVDTFYGLPVGNYEFRTADANGCEDVITITINQPLSTLQISKSIINGSCEGLGELVLNSVGGTGSKEYKINGGLFSSNNTYTNLDNINNAKAFVKDTNNCLDSTVYTIKYLDNIAPTAIAKNITVYLDSANGSVTVNAAWLDNGSFDNCGPVSFTISDSTFNCADIGMNKVDFHVTDTTGNVTTVTDVEITVLDTVKPTALIYSLVHLYLDELGSATLTPNLVDSASFDACGIVPDSTFLGQIVFTCFHAGNTTNVAYRIEDKSDNSRTVTAKVLALDTIAPKLELNTLADRSLDSLGNDTLFLRDVLKTVSDACGVDTVYFDQNTGDTFMLFTCAEKGANTVGVIAEDKFGNKRYASVSVNILDDRAPDSLQILTDTTLFLDANGVANIAKSKVVLYTYDNCGVVDTTMQTTFDCDDLGAKTYTVTVKDAEGNALSKDIEITVIDTFPPDLPVVNAITRYLDSIGADTIDINDLFDGSAVADNCGVVKIYTSDTFFTCGDLGARSVTVYFEDASGNISSETTTITFEDTLAPYNVQVKDTVFAYLDNSGEYTLHDSDYLISLEENCTMKDTTYSQKVFTCLDMDPDGIWVYVTFEDMSGNSTLDSFVVVVRDTTVPFLNVKQKDTLYIPSTVNGTVTVGVADTDLGSSDNNPCIPLDIAIISAKTTFDCDDVNKTFKIVTRATDGSGNISVDTTEILILDTVKPVIVLKPILPTFYLDENGLGIVNINDIDGGTFDNCGIVIREITGKGLDCDDVGTKTISFRVVDKYGNESIKVFDVTVADSIKPTLTVKNATILIDTSANAYLKESDVVVSYDDNCGVATLVLSKEIFGLSDLGDNTVEITLTDTKGNITKKTVIVTVILGDADNDSIPDYIEKNFDTDGDGILNYLDIDSDNDGLADKTENNGRHALVDTDGDGIPDYLDLDSDNDGINDVIENGSVDANGDGINDDINDVKFTAVDTDGDGTDDYRDLDSDGDTIFDIIESLQGHPDTNNDGKLDGAVDSDNDGIMDVADGNASGFGDSGDTKPVDTDNDGTMDFRDLDSDGDQIPDEVEGNVDTDVDGLADYRDLDSDGDKIPDTYEAGADPTKPIDTDGDGKEDFRDTDSDGDKIPDTYEAGIDPTKPVDTDGDGLDDFRDLDSDGDTIPDEVEAGADPNNPIDTDGDGQDDFLDLDSDGDCIPDRVEAGADPNNPVDTDNDGDSDYVDLDSDGDGILDSVEVGPDCNNPVDTDGDGTPDYRDLDSDSDDVPDSEEGLADSDNNGIPDYRDAQYRIPEAISPNGDGVNDLLIIQGLKVYTQAQIIIFNRNGQVVYDSGKGYKNNWNGSNNSGMFTIGTELPEGLYYYVFKPNGQNRKDVTGNIYIKR